MKKLLATIMVAVLCACMNGCGTDKMSIDEMVGTWYQEDGVCIETITIKPDGTYTKVIEYTTGVPMTFDAYGRIDMLTDKIRVHFDSTGGMTTDYKVTFDGNKMTWDNGVQPFSYTRK